MMFACYGYERASVRALRYMRDAAYAMLLAAAAPARGGAP